MRFYLNLFFAIVLFSSLSNQTIAQVGTYGLITTFNPNDTICGFDVSLSFSIGESLEDLNTTVHTSVNYFPYSDSIFDIITLFGDGSPSVSGYFSDLSTQTNNILYVPTHHYNEPGTYHISCGIFSKPLFVMILFSFNVTVGYCSGELATEIEVDCNKDGQIDSLLYQGVPVNILGADGTQMNFVSSATAYQSDLVLAGEYETTISQDWLDENNYFVLSTNSSIQIPDDTLISFVLACVDNTSYQLTSLTPSVISINANNCSSTVNMAFYLESDNPTDTAIQIHQIIQGENFAGFDGGIEVDWGDGSNTWSSATSSTTGTMLPNYSILSHTYNQAGTYSIISTVTNSQDSIGVSDTILFTLTDCFSTFSIETFLDCNGDGISELVVPDTIPYYLTDNFYSYFPVGYISGYALFEDLAFDTYTLHIDSAWLSTMGYIFENNSLQIEVNSYNPTPIPVSATISCNPQEEIDACTHGVVYCDTNQNGIYDTGDIPVPNALVTIQNLSTGSLMDSTFAANNGVYTIDYHAFPNDSIQMCISPTWMNDMGFTSLENSCIAIAANICESGNQASTNLGTNCNGLVGNSLYYSGYVYCDANGNGSYDVDDMYFPYAPIILHGTSVNSDTITVFTNASGVFQFTGVLLGDPNYAVASVDEAWLSDNGFSLNNTSNLFIVFSSTSVSTPTTGIAINCGIFDNCVDLWSQLELISDYIENEDATIKLDWGNNGIYTLNCTMTLQWPSEVTLDLTSVTNQNYSFSSNSITWYFSPNWQPYSSQEILTFHVGSQSNPQAVHNYSSIITASNIFSDCVLENNQSNLILSISNPFGMDEIQPSNVLIYPNPATTEVHLKAKGNFQFEIHNAIGELIQMGSGIDITTIGLSEYATGVYVISLWSNGQFKKGRFLKL